MNIKREISVINSTKKLVETKNVYSLTAYDTLQRPTHGWSQNNETDFLRLTAHAIYGEQATTPKDNNLNGQLWQQYDESGKIESIVFDFKGNLLSKKQQVISNAVLKTALDNYQTYLVDWTGLPSILETQIFETSSEFDAVGRATKITLPKDVENERKEIIPTYNRAGGLEKVHYNGSEYVENIVYNAKGQRLLVAFGNDIMTRYAYDNRTFRLLRQRSEKYVKTQVGNQIIYTPQSGTNKQDDGFNFDLIGNILKVLNRVNDCGISGSALGSDALDRNFEYDPLYRVISGDGRESSTQNQNDYLYSDAPAPGSPNSNNVRAYTRKYAFDKLGNIQQLKQLGSNGFTRNFTYNAGHNTLQKIETAASSLLEDFTYDPCGNQLTAGTTRNYVWNAGNQLVTYYNQVGSADPTIFAQYDYSGINRVSKLVKTGTSANPIYERTIYIDGIFEYHILENGTTYEKNYVHIMDDQSRIAMVRIGTPFPDDIADEVVYNLEDQIGSSTIRLNNNGGIIDKEEYYPFGDSSIRTFAKKRYRYVGKEKDLESGLYYYGARYYAAWTCRFISVDPKSSSAPNLTPYHYTSNNPINRIDPDGMQDEPSGGDTSSTINKTEVTNTNEEGSIKNAASNVVTEKEQAVEDAQSEYDNLVSNHEGDLKKKDIKKYEKESGLKNAKNELIEWKGIESKIDNMIETFKIVMPDKYNYLNNLPVKININYNSSPSPNGENNPQSTKIPASKITIMKFGSDTQATAWTGEFDGDIEITLWGGGNYNSFTTNYLANEFGDIEYFFKNVIVNDPVSYQKWATTGNWRYSGYWKDPTGAGQMSFGYQADFENKFNSIRKSYPIDKIDRINWIIKK